jgi:hypothetical protein
VAFLFGSDIPKVQAIYEKNKGVNDWHIENIGELNDLKFVEDEQDRESDTVYTISKDGLLSLFNTDTQSFVWKKKLTVAQPGEAFAEAFKCRYLSRNLLAHSQRRAMLVNTAGHANFEIDFGSLFGASSVTAQSDGLHPPVAAMFDFEGQIYSCFAFGNSVVVYKAAQYLSTVTLDSTLDSSTVIEPLELVFDTTSQHLIILSRTQKQLRSYQVDLSNFGVELLAQEPYSFPFAARTLHFGVQHNEASSQYSMIDLSTLKEVKSFSGASSKP